MICVICGAPWIEGATICVVCKTEGSYAVVGHKGPSRPELEERKWRKEVLHELLALARKKYEAMSFEEQCKMLEEQRESWVKGEAEMARAFKAGETERD